MNFGYQVRLEMAALKSEDPAKYAELIATVKVPSHRFAPVGDFPDVRDSLLKFGHIIFFTAVERTRGVERNSGELILAPC